MRPAEEWTRAEMIRIHMFSPDRLIALIVGEALEAGRDRDRRPLFRGDGPSPSPLEDRAGFGRTRARNRRRGGADHVQ